MYTACLYCHGRLGSNEAIEHFSVGSRLAFDAAKGRLWVVCGRCRRWNLTPLEERWEAVEECERAFRATRLRSSTSNIGLARLRSGLVLIRIGEPLRPEMAAWRYVDAIRRRRTLALATSGVALTALAGLAFGAYAATGVGAIGGLLFRGGNELRDSRTLYQLRVPFRGWLTVRPSHLRLVRWAPADAAGHIALELPMGDHKPFRLRGPEATRALRPILVHMNRTAGTRQAVTDALGLLDGPGSTREVYMRHWRRAVERAPRAKRAEWWTEATDAFDAGKPLALALSALRADERLALEIETAEDDERKLLAGELAELESAWREAEEIAAIADDLFLPGHVTRWLDRHR